jgi:aspartate 1-decarboxylase
VASIIDGDKRLLFVDSSDNTYDDDGTEHTAYHTKVFECDMDGSNRKSLATFDGQWTDYKSSVIYENKLYFSNVKGYTSTIAGYQADDEYGIPGTVVDSFNTNQLCSLDLDTWELKVYAEEDGNNGFQNLVFTDDALYFVFMTTDYEYILYRLDLEQDTCEELYRSDTTSFVLNGAIGHQLLIAVYNNETKRYDHYLYNEETGQKTMLAEGACAEACVVGNRFAIMTEDVRDTRNREDIDYVETYVFFDADGNELETVHYDQNFFFLFTLDDHVLYDFTTGEDDEQKSGVYEVKLSELQNIREKGRYVYSGWV